MNGAGQSKGSGMIEFADSSDAERAMNTLNGYEIRYRKI